MEHFVSKTCKGEHCTLCGAPATHKVGEEIPHDEILHTAELAAFLKHPVLRHNFTAYVCCEHFTQIMGPAVFCLSSSTVRTGDMPL